MRDLSKKVVGKKSAIKVNPKTSECMESLSRKLEEMKFGDDFDCYEVDYFTDEELDQICEEIVSGMTDDSIMSLDEATVSHGHDTEDPTPAAPSRSDRVKSALKKAASGAKKLAKKVGNAAGQVAGATVAGYRDAKATDGSSSSANTTGNGGSSSTSGGTSTGSSSSSSGSSSGENPRVRLRDRLKNAIKKGVGKLARVTSKVGDKVATRLGEEFELVDVLTFGGYLQERGDFWHPDPEKDSKLGGPGANARAREDRAAAAKPKEDPKKLRPGESYMDYHKRRSSAKNEEFVSEAKKKLMAKVAVKPEKLGYKVADIGPDGKEHNVKTYGAYKEEAAIGESSYLEPDMKKRQKNNEKAIADMKKDKSQDDYRAIARKKLEEGSDDSFSGQATSYKGVVIRRSDTGYECPRYKLVSNSFEGIKNNIDKELKKNQAEVQESTRYAKETGKSFRTGKKVTPGGSAKDDKAFQIVSKLMGKSRVGATQRGEKKEKGGPTPGPSITPEDKVRNRRARAQSGRDNMSSRFD